MFIVFYDGVSARMESYASSSVKLDVLPFFIRIRYFLSRLFLQKVYNWNIDWFKICFTRKFLLQNIFFSISDIYFSSCCSVNIYKFIKNIILIIVLVKKSTFKKVDYVYIANLKQDINLSHYYCHIIINDINYLVYIIYFFE